MSTEPKFNTGDRVTVVEDDSDPAWNKAFVGKHGQVCAMEWADDGYGWGYSVSIPYTGKPSTFIYCYEHELVPFQTEEVST